MERKRWTLEARTEAYFAACQEKGDYPTVTGLALALGMDGRQELDKRAAEDSRAGTALRRARSRVEEANLQAAYRRDSASGARFILQNGFGYTDKREVEVPGTIQVNLVDGGEPHAD